MQTAHSGLNGGALYHCPLPSRGTATQPRAVGRARSAAPGAVTVGRGLCRAALNCVLPIDNHIFATGDDGGAVKVWDLRRGSAILEARQQEEYISAMAVDGNGKILLTARYCRGFVGSGSPCLFMAGVPCAMSRAHSVSLPRPTVGMAPWASST